MRPVDSLEEKTAVKIVKENDMRSVGASHIGKVRTENQDRIFFHDQPVGNLKIFISWQMEWEDTVPVGMPPLCSGTICTADRGIETDRSDRINEIIHCICESGNDRRKPE